MGYKMNINLPENVKYINIMKIREKSNEELREDLENEIINLENKIRNKAENMHKKELYYHIVDLCVRYLIMEDMNHLCESEEFLNNTDVRRLPLKNVKTFKIKGGINLIVKKIKYYKKKVNVLDKLKCYDVQGRRKVTYFLFWIIPIFIIDEYVNGAYENNL